MKARRTRREFLREGGTAMALGLALPAWARAFALRQGGPGTPVARPDNILVIVELAGGNDGLNTVVPYADDLYQKARPTLAYKEKDILKIDDAIGLHPSLGAFRSLYDEGALAIVQSVGYPNPNRSHFLATEIYQTAKPEGVAYAGWVGRRFDGEGGAERGPCSCRVGQTESLALHAERSLTLTLDGPEGLELRTNERARADREPLLSALREIYAEPRRGNPYAARLQESIQGAFAASERLKQVAKDYDAKGYPNSPLAHQLRLVAQMVHAGFGLRAYHVSIGGFDTHANQKKPHANLLQQVGDSLAAFQKDLKAHGHGARVLTMTFSEFGRRLAENGSQGTDHGTTIPMFLIGEKVKGGLYGARPDLADLQDGDPKHVVDFRQVYASVLQGWWGEDPVRVLGGRFDPLPLIN